MIELKYINIPMCVGRM